MSLKYAVKERVFNFDKSKTVKYVPQPVGDGVIDFPKLCKSVALICGAHRGQVKLVLDGLLDAMEMYMDDGKTVKLGEFGSLRPTFRSKSDADLDEVNGSNIYQRRIVFTPGQQLKEMLGSMSIEKYTPIEVATKEEEEETIDPGA